MMVDGEVVDKPKQGYDSAAPAPSRFRSLVNSYMRNRLPLEIHPSFQDVSQVQLASNGPRPLLPAKSQTQPGPQSSCADNVQGRDAQKVAEFSKDDIYKEADVESVRFHGILRNYEKTAGTKYRTGIDLDDSHTWDEVIAKVDNVAKQYQDRSNFWSKVRRGMKKFGENHDAFNGWLGLLPTQSNYCSIICGGLKLIITAAARFKEVRESIFNAIAEIPVLLNNTKLILQVFEDSEELHRSSSELYLSTLTALEHMVTWFQEKATSTHKKCRNMFIITQLTSFREVFKDFPQAGCLRAFVDR